MVLDTSKTKPADLLAPERVLRDYRIAFQSRQMSLIARKEVLTGKAKFGIFGAGKEVAQVAMAGAFRPGDIRSGYYRDQTLLLALGEMTIEAYFAQLYADPDVGRDPASAGRQMNAHFATRMLAEDGSWRDLTRAPQSSADLSPTGSQMPRLVGLAHASKLYRELPALAGSHGFSERGDEIAFGTIGNASCAEGLFWESVNAAGVLGVPLLLSIWDDGYGISVPNEFQITKGNLSQILSGFEREPGERAGYDIYRVRGWDYPVLCQTYLLAAEIVRREHVPAILHVVEMTQPQGHSTSGSHERYKSQERLAWEEEYDCLKAMRHWITQEGLAGARDLDRFEEEDHQLVRAAQRRAWEAFRAPIEAEKRLVVSLAQEVAERSERRPEIADIVHKLERQRASLRRDLLALGREVLFASRGDGGLPRRRLVEVLRQMETANRERYGSHLYSQSEWSVLEVPAVEPEYRDDAPLLNGFEILNRFFDHAFARHPQLVAFGEDVGALGDVNQGFAGLQETYGSLRISDTGIREATIIGQAIGLAMRGLRPIAEIQYLDYILYALQILSDDLATLHWRTRGGQRAPAIVRTRGHRLEGVWHAGSPMAALVHLLRGMVICVPRDMTRAVGMYNTLLQSDDPGLVIEVLNGYRSKERLPENLSEVAVPVGIPETLREGGDVTVVTYGACCPIVLEAAAQLAEIGIEAEVIDVQTLLPFDLEARIAASLRRTNRLVLVDEDVPGGATAYMLQQILEEQRAWSWLDTEPVTVTGAAHRPAYGSDGDYFSKPNRERVFEAVYELLHRCDPRRWPVFYR